MLLMIKVWITIVEAKWHTVWLRFCTRYFWIEQDWCMLWIYTFDWIALVL